jgi:hypothetical protein
LQPFHQDVIRRFVPILGQQTIRAILQWLFADGGLPVYRLFVFGHCKLLACFNETRTDLIEVIS